MHGYPSLVRDARVRFDATQKCPRTVQPAGGAANGTGKARRRAHSTRSKQRRGGACMSAECSGYVWRFSPYKGATFAVHHALGDIANDAHGYELWTSNGEAADKARCTRQAAHRAFKQLLEDGFLTRLGVGEKGVVRYRFNMPKRAPVWTSSALRAVNTEDTDDEQRVNTGDTLLSTEVTARVNTGDTNTNNTTANSTTATDRAAVARTIATGYYDWCKKRTGGPVPNYVAVCAIVRGALKRGCEAADIKHALVALYEHGRMQPNTAMLVDEVVGQLGARFEYSGVRQPKMSAPRTSSLDKVKRCHRDDCDAVVFGDGFYCADEHEQPPPDLPVTIVDEHGNELGDA